MWRTLQQDAPDDYILATGESHTVREFLDAAFGHVGLDWRNFVKSDAKYIRPEANTSAVSLRGNPSRAIARLGWKAQTRLRKLAEAMVESDIKPTSIQQAQF